MALEVLTITAILGLLVMIEPLISLATFLLLGGATTAFIRVVRRRLVYFGQEIQQFRMKMIQTVNEGLGGIKLTKVLGREAHFGRAFAEQSARYAESARFRQIMSDLPRLYLETAAIIGLLGVAALLVAERRSVQSIIPTLSLLAVAVVRMIPSFNRITASMTTIRYGRFSLDVVFADLRALKAERDTPDFPIAPTVEFRRSLELHHLTYQYPGSAAPSIFDVSATIPRGSAVAFVGATGAGKTTLVDLILGLLEPTEGQVLVDGQDVLTNLRGWQRRVGYVPQDTFLVDDTIRRNIAFGLSEHDIDEGALWGAAEAAQLSDFVRALPGGMNTVVGERGVRLSGGQRQRIGIARALYNSPDVMVFDEATSSLDNETEHFVMQAIEKLRGDRTIITIAHRLSTVRYCDRLFLLHNGKLTAEGSYDELLGDSVAFRRLAGAH
jgi:ATP-binding cassette subfamily C protein